jgi:hypothetical protein
MKIESNGVSAENIAGENIMKINGNVWLSKLSI